MESSLLMAALASSNTLSQSGGDFTDRVHGLQDALLQQEQAWHGEIHHFAPGVYLREFRTFENTLLVGKTHRHEHLFVLLEGKCEVATEDGPQLLEAPYIGKSPAGVKRALYTHTDIIWLTIHATNETDVSKIEEWLVVPDEEVRDFRRDMGLDPIVDVTGG